MSLPVIPKKSLGQNFLTSSRVISRIIEASNITHDDVVLEIGPGLGAITEQLITHANKVIAVEKDTALVAIIKEKFAKAIKNNHLELIHGDILNLDPVAITKSIRNDYIIAANIPYNITGLILRKFLESSHQPKRMVILIQREVADRILARDGKESLLSLSVKVYGMPKLVTNVARGNFNPPPRVDSAVIKIDTINKNYFPTKQFEDLFFRIIHAGFAHKRKILIKNLVDASIAERTLLLKIFTDRNLLLTIRSEDLKLEDWIFITHMVYTNH